ncbi:DUF6037 family protein [Carnobacterium viridans]|uniref:Uncharacterized protein n=1 Tax=Carnobacterium viridans TaxID=174587 RepID=A0A1H0XYN4_9LACT|nr:DUF6037 family protein [Carnobacterium viridans]UDE95450.1 DUF6037 family protein [Carnobacterium viridans]SDQ07945.1 hypothetical protein SAMN04487752_0577 [Carnobacterium viridans]
MPPILGNFKELKRNMEIDDWVIDSFCFESKKQNYIVLVKLYNTTEKRPEYALLKLEFFYENDFSKKLEAPANSARVMFDSVTEFIDFFGIETNGKGNIQEIFTTFYQKLAERIPTCVTPKKSSAQKIVMVNSINKSMSENENSVYCYKVKRNPLRKDGSLGQRSTYNDNKTRILREYLYEKLKSDTNLSFCYSEDPDMNYTDELIISNWTRNKNNTKSTSDLG